MGDLDHPTWGPEEDFAEDGFFFLSNFFQIVVKRTNIGFTVVSTSRCGPAARCAFTLPTPGLPRLPEAKPCAHWTPPPRAPPLCKSPSRRHFLEHPHCPQDERRPVHWPSARSPSPSSHGRGPWPLPLAQPCVRMPAGGCERKSEAVWCQILEIIPASAGGTGSRGPPSRHVQRPREEEMVLGALRG